MRRKGESGFTLIELLVVILIIGVLAAIAVPLFVHQRTKAYDTHAKTAIRTATTAIEVYRQEHTTYAGVDAAALVAIESALGEARGLTVSGDADGFAISVDSASGAQGGGPFTVTRSGDTTERACGAPGQGGCPDSGTW